LNGREGIPILDSVGNMIFRLMNAVNEHRVVLHPKIVIHFNDAGLF
jgi:hypothetical protein